MKTILSRLKTLINNNRTDTGTLSYVRHVEILHPEIGMTVISIATLPAVFFTPINAAETWVASQRKQVVNSVVAYLILAYHQRESSIMGDSSRPAGHGKGIMDFTTDFLTVLRGHRLAVEGTEYLDKPLDVTNIDYIVDNLGDNAHIIVAAVAMECTRLFLQATLPGDI